MRAEPLTLDRLADRITRRVPEASPATPATWTVIAIDGAPTAGGADLAAELVTALEHRDRTALAISTADFLRPRSQRLEYGREDPDVFYDEWLDVKTLYREVFDPLAPGGTGRILPKFWNTETDRSARAHYVELPPGGILIVEGWLLLGRRLPFDITVHLSQSPLALSRRTPPDLAWTLPAYMRYEDEVDPSRTADITARMDDPRHPALLHL